MAVVNSVAVKPRRPGGPPLPPRWRQTFLAEYKRTGAKYHSADVAGIEPDTVVAHQNRDPAFDAQVEHARQLFADSREINLARLADKGNVVGDIVLLKRHRPQEYIERQAVAVDVTHRLAESVADPTALLRAMLHAATPATLKALAPPPTIVDTTATALVRDASNSTAAT